MHAVAAKPVQFIAMRPQGWMLVAPAHERHAHFERRHAPPSVIPVAPPAAPAPQAIDDIIETKARGRSHVFHASLGDKEHSRIRYTDRTHADANRDLNETAFEFDTPWGRRPDRGMVGFAKFKSKFRR